MKIASERVVSGTPGGVMWGETPEGLPCLALVGMGTRTLVVFDSPREAIDFGAQASYAGVAMLIAASSRPGHASQDGEPEAPSSILAPDGSPLSFRRGN